MRLAVAHGVVSPLQASLGAAVRLVEEEEEEDGAAGVTKKRDENLSDTFYTSALLIIFMRSNTAGGALEAYRPIWRIYRKQSESLSVLTLKLFLQRLTVNFTRETEPRRACVVAY